MSFDRFPSQYHEQRDAGPSNIIGWVIRYHAAFVESAFKDGVFVCYAIDDALIFDTQEEAINKACQIDMNDLEVEPVYEG